MKRLSVDEGGGGGGGGAAAGGPGASGDGGVAPAPVPYARFAEVLGEAKAAKADAEAARAEAATARSAADAAATAAAGWETERAGLASQIADKDRRIGLGRVGVHDDEHLSAVAAAYGAVPEASRPKSEADYWTEVTAGRIAPPRGLVGFLPAAGSAGRAAPPPPPPSATGDAAGSGAVTATQLDDARRAFVAKPTAESRAAYFALADKAKAQVKTGRA